MGVSGRLGPRLFNKKLVIQVQHLLFTPWSAKAWFRIKAFLYQNKKKLWFTRIGLPCSLTIHHLGRVYVLRRSPFGVDYVYHKYTRPDSKTYAFDAFINIFALLIYVAPDSNPHKFNLHPASKQKSDTFSTLWAS